jgi:putative lipoprotein
MAQLRVTGEVLLAAGSAVSARAVIHVHLLDTSLADAPSTVIASQVIDGIAGKIARGEALRFELHSPIQNRRASFSVSVHVDMDADGKVGPGDFINAQSYPVTTNGDPTQIIVKTMLVA